MSNIVEYHDPFYPNSVHNLEEYVNTLEFDHQCLEKLEASDGTLSLNENESGNFFEDWSSDGVSSAITIYEANRYYAGVSPYRCGPKLIYRTSDDKFEPPTGPEAYRRLMRVVAVPDSHEFGQNGMWDTVRDRVVELLNQRNIKVSSVDFVRFTWLNKKAYHEIEEEEEDITHDDIPFLRRPIEYGKRHYTNPTIWIGVLPQSLTGAIAHKSSEDIRAFLDSLQVQNVDIAYRESVYKALLGHGPALFKPAVEDIDDDPLKGVIDNVSVALSLPIAGRKTGMQGTLGPYFHAGDKLYAITTRHNLFLPSWDGNELYRYHESAHKKEVFVMDTSAFERYLDSIQAHIGLHNQSAEIIEKRVNACRARLRDGINVQKVKTLLDMHEAKLAQARTKINDIKNFFVDIKKRWSKPKDRVIGFVRWAPPIGTGVAPHRYTRDLCVIELYKEKFKHMIGNVLSLGPELSPMELETLMYERNDAPTEFRYPEDGLLTLGGILTTDQIKNPNISSLHGDRIRRVLKRGFATNTTVGTITRFMSFVRQYFTIGIMESLEVPILSHEHDSDTFSKGGDSGSLIVSPRGEFVALLTGGTSKGTNGSDITFATPFEWVWDLVKEEFPDGNLYFDNLQEFLADVG